MRFAFSTLACLGLLFQSTTPHAVSVGDVHTGVARADRTNGAEALSDGINGAKAPSHVLSASDGAEAPSHVLSASDGAEAPSYVPSAPDARKAAGVRRFDTLPLRFEPNVGQARTPVQFVARSARHSLLFTRDGLTLARPGASRIQPLRLRWFGANAGVSIEAADPLRARTNYLVGEPGTWRTNVPNYGRVRYHHVYPGIDLEYHGETGRLEYDFIVAPGGDPRHIRMRITGARRIVVNETGSIALSSGADRIEFEKPIAFQELGAGRARRPVDCRYDVRGHDVRFVLGAFDRSLPLVIDPQVTYSTYLGGTGSDKGVSVAVDPSGAVYVVGQSSSFPVIGGGGAASPGVASALVVKLDPSIGGAGSVIYSTYIGGSAPTIGRAVAVNAAGDVFVAGDTTAPDFPTTPGAYRTACVKSGTACSSDVFAVKLDPSGTALTYSTLLGGAGTEFAFGLTADTFGHVFLTGPTGSSNFPTTSGAYQRTFRGGGTKFGDAFVAELNPAGGGAADLLYSTYLGGSGSEQSWTIAVDDSANIVVGGSTTSTNYPTTATAFSRTYRGAGNIGLGDAFVSKLHAGGAGAADLIYSTYLGGANDDRVESLALDAQGFVYATGFTQSSGFPVTAATAYQPAFRGGTCNGAPCGDVILAKLDTAKPGAASLVYSTFYGGSSFDLGHALTIDGTGVISIAGETASKNLPMANPIQATCTAGCTPLPEDDLFVARFDVTQPGSAGLLFSSYLGGSDVDTAWSMAGDGNGNLYLTGQVFSTDFPTMLPFQATCRNCTPFTSASPSGDMFLVKICTIACPGIAASPSALTFAGQPIGTTSGPQAVSITNTGAGALTIAGIGTAGTNPGDFGVTTDCPAVLAAQASCTVNVAFTAGATGSRTAVLSITDNAPLSPHTVTLTGTGTAATVTPWPNGYTYKATFTTAAGKVPSPQEDFPVLIAGAFADFRTTANGGRIARLCTQSIGTDSITVPCDLIFTSDAAGTTPLSWEFERFDAATGSVLIWVRVPSLGAGTVIYAWYGNGATTVLQSTASAVWSDRFAAVFHMKERPDGVAPQVNDSTANANHCTAMGSMPAAQQVPGQIGGSLSFSGGTYYLTCPNVDRLAFERTDSWSMSAWSRPVANTAGAIVAKEQDSTTRLQGWEMFWRNGTSNPTVAVELANTATLRFATRTTAEFAAGSFHHVVSTYNGSGVAAGVTIYVDGTPRSKTNITDALGANSILTSAAPQVAARGGAFLRSSGTDDEIRIYNRGVVLPASWVTTEYNNQNGPSTFFTVVTGLTAN